MIACTTAYASYLLLEYLAGGGTVTLELGRTPVFNNATLEYLVACALLCLADGMFRRITVLNLVGMLIPTIVIVLAFRRFAWVELAIGVMVVLVMHFWRHEWNVQSWSRRLF